MNITKSEAIVMLAVSIGNADGEFSIWEIREALSNEPAFTEAFIEAQLSGWSAKLRLGELTVDSALKALNELTVEDKAEAMNICRDIVLSDGETKDAEIEQVESWIKKLGLDPEDIKGNKQPAEQFFHFSI